MASNSFSRGQYLARKAANQRAYRARQKAKADGATPPPKPKPRRRTSADNSVAGASVQASAARMRRAQLVESLPSARNPATRIYVPREPDHAPDTMAKTAKGQQSQARAIRENERAKKLQAVGRARKQEFLQELTDRADTARVQAKLHPEDRERFRSAIARLAKGSYQSIALLMDYQGGYGDYTAALERLKYPKSDAYDVDEALGRLEALAEVSERAAAMYSPTAMKQRGLGGKSGRLSH